MRVHAFPDAWARLHLLTPASRLVHRLSVGVAGLRERWRRWDRPRDLLWLLIVGVLVLAWLWVLWTGSVFRRH